MNKFNIFTFELLFYSASTLLSYEVHIIHLVDILNNLSGKGYEKYMEENFGATPMVLIVKNNKIIGASTGYSEYDAFKNVLNEAGIK